MEPIKIKVLKYIDKNKKPITTHISNSLENIQKTVGVDGDPNAYFETVTLPIRHKRFLVAIMDEEGKLKGLPLVRGLYDDAGCLVDTIHGVFFVCAVYGDDFDGLTDDEVQLVKNYFRDGDL